MKKRNIAIAIALMVTSFYFGGVFKGEEKYSKEITPHSEGMIAMYIQDDDGNYNLSDAQEFPKDGYVLNTEKSSCKNGGVITQNSSTKALSLKVKTSDECTVYFDVVKGPVVGEGAKTLLAKMNDASIIDYNSRNKKEMFVFDHPEAEQTTGWTEEERRDYRYIENQPNNYITFNNEIWRIIGVFTVETESGSKEQLIKIIKDVSIVDIPWNLNSGYDYRNE